MATRLSAAERRKKLEEQAQAEFKKRAEHFLSTYPERFAAVMHYFTTHFGPESVQLDSGNNHLYKFEQYRVWGGTSERLYANPAVLGEALTETHLSQFEEVEAVVRSHQEQLEKQRQHEMAVKAAREKLVKLMSKEELKLLGLTDSYGGLKLPEKTEDYFMEG